MNFSVLITVYYKDNVNYFVEAINSISLEQSKKPSEIVLVCDGALTEELETEIEKLKKKITYLKVFRLEQNIGQGNALNFGLEKCSFDLVARMDSDDISLPNRFKEQIEFMQIKPNIHVLSSTVEEFSGDKITYRKLPEDHKSLDNIINYRAPVNHGCCVYRKEKVISVGGYSELYQCQDYLLWIKILLNGGRFHNLQNCHMRVRMEQGFSRKMGLNYAKEEFFIQKYMYKHGVTNIIVFARNVVFKVLGRLLPEKIINFLYERFFR